MDGWSAICVAWGSGIAVFSLYGYVKLGFSRLGFFAFLSGIFCLSAGLLP